LLLRAKIQEWRESNDKELQKKFGPVKIREALDAHDKATGKKRGEIYKQMSIYAAHPTPKGLLLLCPKGPAEIGPFFHEKFLKNLLRELVKNLVFFALAYTGHFSDVSIMLLGGKAAFLDDLNAWGKKYLGPRRPEARSIAAAQIRALDAGVSAALDGAFQGFSFLLHELDSGQTAIRKRQVTGKFLAKRGRGQYLLRESVGESANI